MNTTSDTRFNLDLVSVVGHATTDEPTSVATPSKAEVYARAAQQMRRGRRVVISGFVVAVLGIVAYCVVCLSAAMNQELGSTLLDNPGWLAGPTLGIIGLGSLLWLAGSFLYLSGGMDSDPDGPELYFQAAVRSSLRQRKNLLLCPWVTSRLRERREERPMPLFPANAAVVLIARLSHGFERSGS